MSEYIFGAIFAVLKRRWLDELGPTEEENSNKERKNYRYISLAPKNILSNPDQCGFKKSDPDPAKKGPDHGISNFLNIQQKDCSGWEAS